MLVKSKIVVWVKNRGANVKDVDAAEKAAYLTVREAMDPLLEYLDVNFEMFSEFLYEDVFGFLMEVVNPLCVVALS